MRARGGQGCEHPQTRGGSCAPRPSQRRRRGRRSLWALCSLWPHSLLQPPEGKRNNKGSAPAPPCKDLCLLSWLLHLFTHANAAPQVLLWSVLEVNTWNKGQFYTNEIKLKIKTEMTEIIWTGKNDMTSSNQEMGTKIT